MSLRVIPMSANSRSLNWESSCTASPYRFQLWKKRITGDNMGFRPFSGNWPESLRKYGAPLLHRNKIAAAQLTEKCMVRGTYYLRRWACCSQDRDIKEYMRRAMSLERALPQSAGRSALTPGSNHLVFCGV